MKKDGRGHLITGMRFSEITIRRIDADTATKS
jgi:hypothetical protein